MLISGPTIPVVLAEQGATLGILAGRTVTIDCDTHEEALSVFGWLVELTAQGMPAMPETGTGSAPKEGQPGPPKEDAPITVSPEAFAALTDALDNPPKPTEALKKLMRKK